MDCNHARLLLTFANKKAELDAAASVALQAHLDQCPDCDAMTRAERGVDDVLGRAMRAVPIPSGLRSSLLDRVHQQGRRRLRHIALIGSGVAAALVLTGWGIWQGFYARPPVTWPDVVDWSEQQGQSMVVANDPEDAPERVEQWFSDKGMPMEAPRSFNYALLKSFDTALFKGRVVPKLVFARNDRDQVAVADVYVLSDSQFDLTDLQNELEKKKELRLPTSGFTLQATPSPGGFIFLVIFQGGLLEAFHNKPDA